MTMNVCNKTKVEQCLNCCCFSVLLFLFVMVVIVGFGCLCECRSSVPAVPLVIVVNFVVFIVWPRPKVGWFLNVSLALSGAVNYVVDWTNLWLFWRRKENGERRKGLLALDTHWGKISQVAASSLLQEHSHSLFTAQLVVD